MIPSSHSKSTSHDSSSVKKYTGVRRTPSGRWRSDIRVSKSDERTWLGTYDSPEEAARAHDAATVRIHGSHPEVLRNLNFPNSPPDIPNSGDQPFSGDQLQEIARQHTNVDQPALGTGEQSNEKEVEEEKRNDEAEVLLKKGNNDDNKDKNYTGVRQRSWGSWVTDIKRPGEQKRIWLGSYDSAEKAACAHDAATVCIYGSQPEVLRNLNFPDAPPEIPNSDGQPFSKKKIQEIASRHAHGANTGPLQPALDIGEPSNEREVENENENDNPIDWSFMDENRNDNPVDWSLVDAPASPVLPRQAGLDFSGSDFLPLSESAPEHQVLDNAEEEEIRLWDFSD